MPALAIGFIAGMFCFWMVTKFKAMFGYDDALDAFGVHGAGGTIGALLTGVFAQTVIQPDLWRRQSGGRIGRALGPSGEPTGGGGDRVVLALVGTIVILKMVDLVTGLRVQEEQEVAGLDITLHGEEGYNLEA